MTDLQKLIRKLGELVETGEPQEGQPILRERLSLDDFDDKQIQWLYKISKEATTPKPPRRRASNAHGTSN